MNCAENAAAVFEQRRPFLLGLAYRILGSRAEAEDAVQELFIKWLEADRDSIATNAPLRGCRYSRRNVARDRASVAARLTNRRATAAGIGP